MRMPQSRCRLAVGGDLDQIDGVAYVKELNDKGLPVITVANEINLACKSLDTTTHGSLILCDLFQFLEFGVLPKSFPSLFQAFANYLNLFLVGLESCQPIFFGSRRVIGRRQPCIRAGTVTGLCETTLFELFF